MTQWRRVLREQSYSRSFIWKTANAILLGSIALGGLVDLVVRFQSRPSTQELAIDIANSEFQYFNGSLRDDQNIPPSLIEFLHNPEITVEDALSATSYIAPHFIGPNQTQISQLLFQRFDDQTVALLRDYFIATSRPKSPSRERLEQSALFEPTPRYANRLIGELELNARQYNRAYPYFKREGLFPEAEKSRQLAVAMLVYGERFDELSELLTDPAYESYKTTSIKLDIAIHQLNWWNVAKTLPIKMFSNIDWKMATIALIAALVWAALLLRLGQIESWRSRTSGLCLLAFIAGWLSAIPTVFLVILQDAYLGYKPNGELIPTIAYYIGGVGLREEFCKIIFFLPFAFSLARKGVELESMIIASFIGLGFAAEENVSYFSNSFALAAPARFLTANFFHISLTGMGGLFLCRAIRKSNYNDFLYVFGIIVVVHGVYNSFLSLPQFQEGYFFAMITYILMSMYYFRELNGVTYRNTPSYSLSFIFVSGLCLILASLIIFQSSQVGIASALKIIVPETVGSIIMIFMFFREFNEALGE